jgi:paraquat-inducible protein A
LSLAAAATDDLAMACATCGVVSLAPRGAGAPRSAFGGVTLACARCGSSLERTAGKSLDAALACAAAAFILLIPANLLPLITTYAAGSSRTSHLISTATAMWKDQKPWVGLLVTLFLVVFPLARFGLLTVVLGRLRLSRPAPWLGRAFRWANELQPWAMADVFLLAMLITYARLAVTIPVVLGLGAYCFIGAGVLTLFTRATLDKAAIWEGIAPAGAVPSGQTVACAHCGLVLPLATDGQDCPRCQAKVHVRKPGSLRRAAALTLAGLLLYLPANIYPIATLPIGLTPTHYTVLEGVIDLVQAHLLGLGLVVLMASFVIPTVKLVGLGWCVISVLRRSSRALPAKSRMYHFVDEIGRWSMIDPFVIGAFVPVMQYNDVITGRAEPAAVAFSAVVVATMIAARAFDPRLMWDVAGAPA